LPQAWTLMRTCPTSGLGISRSTISKSPPALGICAAFIGAIANFVLAINPPFAKTLEISIPNSSFFRTATNGQRERRRPRGGPLLLLDLPVPGRGQRPQRPVCLRFPPLAATV